MTSRFKNVVKYTTAATTVALAAVFIWFIKQVEEESETYCNKGSGKTTVVCRAFDQITKKPLDSVQLIIRYGISMDRLVDTLLHQKENINYSFTVNENDCENYWIDISNRKYLHEVTFDDDSYGPLEKGRTNHITAWLTPATTVTLSLTRNRNNTASDTVQLYIIDKNPPLTDEEGMSDGRFSDYTHADFLDSDTTMVYLPSPYSYVDEGNTRTISIDHPFRSGTTYNVLWIRKDDLTIDTIATEFDATPFDTVQLQYAFPSR